LEADYVTVVEDGPIGQMCPQNIVFQL